MSTLYSPPSCACVSVDPDTCARIRYQRPVLSFTREDRDDQPRDPCDCSCHAPDLDAPDDLDELELT